MPSNVPFSDVLSSSIRPTPPRSVLVLTAQGVFSVSAVRTIDVMRFCANYDRPRLSSLFCDLQDGYQAEGSLSEEMLLCRKEALVASIALLDSNDADDVKGFVFHMVNQFGAFIHDVAG